MGVCFSLRPHAIDQAHTNIIQSLFAACPQTSYYFPNVQQSTNYIRLKKPVPHLDEFTICGRFNPSTSSTDSWFSYANTRYTDAFTIKMTTSYVYLYLNGRSWKESMSFSINREYHVCFTTFAATTANSYMFVDGELEEVFQGTRGVIEGGGIFIMGMDQDAFGGGLSSSESVQGVLSNFMVWERVLTFDEIEKMYENRCFCPPNYSFTLEYNNIDMFGAVSGLPTRSCTP